MLDILCHDFDIPQYLSIRKSNKGTFDRPKHYPTSVNSRIQLRVQYY